jgi:ATP-dependent protease ClpP protease subunit
MSKKKLNISAVANENNTGAVITLDGFIFDFNGNCAANFKDQVNRLIALGIKDVMLYINSPGGDCFEAAEISNVIRKFEGAINCELGAVCASAASYIASNCDYVVAAANTNYMIHKPKGSLSGNANEIKADLKALENLELDYLNTYIKKTGLTAEKIQEMWANDYWMNATEAKELGFINDYEEQETEITEDDVLFVSAYKNPPKITATAKSNQNQNPTKMEYKKLLIVALSMDSAASDTEVEAKFKATVEKASKYEAVAAELKTVKEQAEDAKIEVELDAAIANKQFVAAQRDFYKKNFKADFDGTKAEVAKLPKIVALSTQVVTGTGATTSEDRTNWKWDDYAKNDHKSLHAMATADSAKYNALGVEKYGEATWNKGNK